MYVGTTFRGSNADMQLFHNGQSDLVHPNLDYDIVSLSNAFAYSFEQGVNLASSMLNAPFLIANLYDYVVMHSETLGIDDPEWTRIVKTRSCSPMGTALSKNIYSVMIPNIGKFLYYSTSEPTMRQKQLATYIAWIVSQFSREKFYTSDFDMTPQGAFLLHLICEQFDILDSQSKPLFHDNLTQRKQLLACFYNDTPDKCVTEISKICNGTNYIALYKQKYLIFLFSQLSPEQDADLEKLLRRYNSYAGLSYPFSSYKECHKHTSQAIAMLHEAVKQGGKDHLTQYENLFVLDILHNYSSDMPLSSFRHPVFISLDEYDKNNDTELYMTLMAYIENSGNTSETAKQLSTHHNTVSYRLRQIAKITGYDVQVPSSRAALLYAIAVEHTLE